MIVSCLTSPVVAVNKSVMGGKHGDALDVGSACGKS